MIAKKRLSLTLAAGISVEILNKIVPLIILHFAQSRLGLAAFGYAQFGLAAMEMAIPFITFGYNNYGAIQVGQHRDDPAYISSLMSNIITLKLLHALVIFGMLIYMAAYVPGYTEYLPLFLSLGFVLFFAAGETLWVQMGIQRMALAGLFTGIARFTSLGLILLMISRPQDAILYAALTLGSNAMICLMTMTYCFAKFRLTRPRLRDMKTIAAGSLMFAIVSILITFLDRFDILLAEKFFGSDGAGLYAGAARLNHSFLQIVNVIVISFFSEMVAIKDEKALARHLRLGVGLVMFAIVPTIVGTWYIGADLLQLIMGASEFRAMNPTLCLLLISTLAESFVLIFGFQILLLHGKARRMVLGMLLGALCALAAATALAKTNGLLGIAAGALLGKGVAATVITVLALPFMSHFPLGEIAKALLAGLIMFVALLLLPADHRWVSVFGAAAIYLLAQGGLNFNILRELGEALKRRKV